MCGAAGKGVSGGGGGAVGGALSALSEIEAKIQDNTYSVVSVHIIAHHQLSLFCFQCMHVELLGVLGLVDSSSLIYLEKL